LKNETPKDATQFKSLFHPPFSKAPEVREHLTANPRRPLLRYTLRVSLHEFFFENFAGDLEYHPRRAALYLALAVAAAAFWFFSPAETKFTTAPLVFALGALTLLTKGIFLLRRSSEGLGFSENDLAALSDPANRKKLPSIPAQAAQILQDFGAGSLLLWPLLNVGKDIDQSWSDPPRLQVFAAGAVLFLLGWTIRRLTTAC
jgi:hypothetical protein